MSHVTPLRSVSILFAALLAVLLLAVTAADCQAECCNHGRRHRNHCDSGSLLFYGHPQMICSPFALETPLCGYYMPRGCNCNSWTWSDRYAPRESYAQNPHAYGFDPVEFQRLGEIPNDLTLDDLGQ